MFRTSIEKVRAVGKLYLGKYVTSVPKDFPLYKENLVLDKKMKLFINHLNAVENPNFNNEQKISNLRKFISENENTITNYTLKLEEMISQLEHSNSGHVETNKAMAYSAFILSDMTVQERKKMLDNVLLIKNKLDKFFNKSKLYEQFENDFEKIGINRLHSATCHYFKQDTIWLTKIINCYFNDGRTQVVVPHLDDIVKLLYLEKHAVNQHACLFKSDTNTLATFTKHDKLVLLYLYIENYFLFKKNLMIGTNDQYLGGVTYEYNVVKKIDNSGKELVYANPPYKYNALDFKLRREQYMSLSSCNRSIHNILADITYNGNEAYQKVDLESKEFFCKIEEL